MTFSNGGLQALQAVGTCCYGSLNTKPAKLVRERNINQTLLVHTPGWPWAETLSIIIIIIIIIIILKSAIAQLCLGEFKLLRPKQKLHKLKQHSTVMPAQSSCGSEFSTCVAYCSQFHVHERGEKRTLRVRVHVVRVCASARASVCI